MRRLLFLLVLPVAGVATAQPTEIRPANPAKTYLATAGRMEVDSGFPVVVFGTDYRSAPAAPEEMAREYLRARESSLGLREAELVHTGTWSSPIATRVRFEQQVDGIPVYHSDVVVTVAADGRVAFLVNGYRRGLDGLARKAARTIAAGQAVAIARDYLGVTTEPQAEEIRTMIFADGARPGLVQQVRLRTSLPGLREWEVLVEASSGRVVRAVNRAPSSRASGAVKVPAEGALGFGSASRSVSASNLAAASPASGAALSAAPFRTDGTGRVFNPDPLSTAGAVYGGIWVDNNDADSPALTSQLKDVTLRDITFNGSAYELTGPYVEIVDVEAPFDGVFSQATPDWMVTRASDAFEAVNAYFHIDASLRYINGTLGLNVSPYQYSGGVKVDPHGADGDDQSYYSAGDGVLVFGEGGVDDAEDADVLLHELGHGIHDWITQGGLSQEDGLSEGFGDYWANSFHRSTGLWAQGTDQRGWVFHWDGHNEYFEGRTTDYAGHYPDDLIDRIHTDGQMWASSLMEIWEQLGRETTDRLVLEGMSMTGSTSNQADAAFAVIQADSLLHGGANVPVILDVFRRRGYLLQAGFVADLHAGPGPLTVRFTDVSFAAGAGVQSWAWDLDGDGTVDSREKSPTFTYQDPGLYSVSLTVNDGSSDLTHAEEDYVSVNDGVYVWQGGRGQFDRSGEFLDSYFTAGGWQHAYSSSSAVHAPLTGYQAVFLSLGAFDTEATELNGSMADLLDSYVRSGGHVFVDGAEAFGVDQADNQGFLELFGLQSTADGSADNTPVVNLAGQPGSLAEGLIFTASSQVGVSWMDVYEPAPGAIALFRESAVGVVGVQNESAQGGRTVVMSYALGQLVDGPQPSTRAELMARIMAFFGLEAHATGVVQNDVPATIVLEPLYPNPVADRVSIGFMLDAPSAATVGIFDALGRRVAAVESGSWLAAGRHVHQVDVSTLASGIYQVRLETSGGVQRRPLVVVR